MTFAARMRVKAAHAEARDADRARLSSEAGQVRRVHEREEMQKKIGYLVSGKWKECIEEAAGNAKLSVILRNAAVSSFTGTTREAYEREVCAYGRKLLEQEGFVVQIQEERRRYSADDPGKNEIDLIVTWKLP